MSVWVKRADLEDFEYRLLKRMEELRQRIGAARAREREEPLTQIAGEVPDAPDAAVANVTFETANAEILRDHDERRELDEALGRLCAGSYGICLRCGQPLERARLEAYPAAKRHSQCQNAHEWDLKLRRVS
jgi:DnaK suppressor protein